MLGGAVQFYLRGSGEILQVFKLEGAVLEVSVPGKSHWQHSKSPLSGYCCETCEPETDRDSEHGNEVKMKRKENNQERVGDFK